MKDEVRCHNDAIQPSPDYELKDLPHLLHVIRIRSFRPPRTAYGDLVNIVGYDTLLRLRHVKPPLRPVLDIGI
jgi:hypothetical protein